MRHDDTVADWVAGLAFIAAVAAVSIFAVHSCKERQRCEAAGGHIERYDCHTQFVTTSCGQGCFMTTPQEYCSERCVGAKAEQPK